MPEPFTVAYRILKVGKRGFWWWRHMVIAGIEPIDAPVPDEESFLEEEEYLWRF